MPPKIEPAANENVVPLYANAISIASASYSSEPLAHIQQGIHDQFDQQTSNGDDMAAPTREEIGAQIKASEAGTETKIVRLEGKIDTLTATIVGKIDSLKEDVTQANQYNQGTRWVLFGTFIGGVFALAAVLVTLASYGDAIFSRGMSVRDVVSAVIKEQQDAQRRDAASTPSIQAPTVPPSTNSPQNTRQR